MLSGTLLEKTQAQVFLVELRNFLEEIFNKTVPGD